MAALQQRVDLWNNIKQLATQLNEDIRVSYRYSSTQSLNNEYQRLLDLLPPPELLPPQELFPIYINEYVRGRYVQRMDVYEFKLLGLSYNLNNDVSMIRNVIIPHIQGQTIIRVYNGIEFTNIYRIPILTPETTIHIYYDLVTILYKMFSENYYGGSLIIQLIPTITQNPELNRLFDGFYNCAIGPIIYHIAQLKTNKHINAQINKLKKLNQKVLDGGEGANENILQEIANISGFKLSVIDKMKKIWKEFVPKKSPRKVNILMEVKGNHLVSKYEEQLNQIKTEGDIFSIKYEEIKLEIFNKEQKIEWFNDLTKICKQHPTSNIITSKGDIKAIITSNIIYKKIFNEYEFYPDAFTNGGVAKMKFLEQNPEFKMYKPNIFDEVLLKSDIRSFYIRTEESKLTNYKYDHNHSYKSFKNSNIFNGFPIIEGCVNVNKYVNECEKLFDNHGLFYIDIENKEEKVNEYKYLHGINKYSCGDKLYYDIDGWYPIEIVKYYYEKHGQNPKIKQMMFGSRTFNIDEKKMTNNQLREFIGKTYSNYANDIWRTNNYSEFLRARYILRENILNIDDKDGIYSITYKKEKKQWCMPIIYTYVLRHQKFIMFEYLNRLAENNIVPVHVCVDGIELRERSDIFDIGCNPGQWKLEKINMNLDQKPFMLIGEFSERVKDCINIDDVKSIIPGGFDIINKHKYIHISGPAGNGKSHASKQLLKIYKDVGICAPTHQSVRILNSEDCGRAKTYHKMFNINNDYPILIKPIYFIDECSMLSAEHLDIIIKKVPNSKIVIFGDFCQLPVVKGTSINNHDIYKNFKIIELKKNWRQKDDLKYFEICNTLREKMTYKDAINIIEKLNERVLPTEIPKKLYDTKNDIYICGVNIQVDYINSLFELKNGCKIIAKKTMQNYFNGMKGELYNDTIIWENNDKLITKDLKAFKEKFTKGYAITCHKSQGSTYIGNVIINPSRLFERNHLYVALTRATKFENIYLTEKIRFDTFIKTCEVIGYENYLTNNGEIFEICDNGDELGDTDEIFEIYDE